MDIYSIVFNGFQLNDLTYTKGVKWHDFDRMPDAQRSISPVTQANRSVATSDFWVQKSARVTILLVGCPKHVLDAYIGRVRQVLQNKGSLVLNKGIPTLVDGEYEYDDWTSLTYTEAILDNVTFDTEGMVSEVNIDFLILDPIGVGGTKQTIYSGTMTSSPLNIDLSSLDIQGTFDNQFPVYTFTVNSITAGSSPSLSIYNGFNTITIDYAFTAGDVLVVDTDNLLVTLNNDLIDFNGVFPNIQNNTQPLVITDTFSARNITVLVEEYPRYI